MCDVIADFFFISLGRLINEAKLYTHALYTKFRMSHMINYVIIFDYNLDFLERKTTNYSDTVMPCPRVCEAG